MAGVGHDGAMVFPKLGEHEASPAFAENACVIEYDVDKFAVSDLYCCSMLSVNNPATPSGKSTPPHEFATE